MLLSAVDHGLVMQDKSIVDALVFTASELAMPANLPPAPLAWSRVGRHRPCLIDGTVELYNLTWREGGEACT